MAEERSFEQALQRLEAVVQELESENADLEHALSLFAEGVELSHYCRQVLQRCDAQVEVLRRQLNGEWAPEPIELD